MGGFLCSLLWLLLLSYVVSAMVAAGTHARTDAGVGGGVGGREGVLYLRQFRRRHDGVGLLQQLASLALVVVRAVM